MPTEYEPIAGGVRRYRESTTMPGQVDEASIPEDSNNADWQEYQTWLTDPANTPRPARPSPAHVWNGTAWVVDNDRQAVVNFLAQLDTDFESVKGDSSIRTFLRMTPAQVDSYIDANVTNIAQARTVLKVLAKVVSVTTRAVIAQQG
jgi:hypothetical protein